jgi:enoyl-CoA hydratase/carnithine racemase
MSNMPNDNPLLVEVRDGVLVATLNRPHRRNALDQTLIDALRALWADAHRMAGLRAIVITAAEPGFCGGADISMLSSDRSAARLRAKDELSFLPGLQVDCPVIVAVNGVCAGGGLHFVADADIAIAADDASFLDPHVTVGQVSALEPLTLWLRSRPQTIMRMALIGATERVTAAQALEAGLVSEVVPSGQLQDRARELALAIAGNSPAAVASTRRLIRTFEEHLLEKALDDGWAAIRAHWSHPDAQEGPRAFSEKRKPQWAEQKRA